MNRWEIGDVTITRVVELEMSGGTRFILPDALRDAVKTIAWLRPHFADEAGNWDAGAGVRAEPSAEGGLTLHGRRGFVQDAASADVLLVVAERDGEPVQATVPTDAHGVTVRPLQTLDLSRRLAHVDLGGVAVGADAVVATDAAALDTQLQQAVVLTAAETVGALDELVTMTVAYAKDRIAFGRPIGANQAVAFACADLLAHYEAARHLTYHAAWLHDQGRPYKREAAVAKLQSTESAVAATRIATQVFGGYGFMDETLVARQYRDAKILEIGEGTSEIQRLVIARSLGLPV